MQVITLKQDPHRKLKHISNMGHFSKVDVSGAFKESGGLNWIGLGTEARRVNPAKVDPHTSRRRAATGVVVVVVTVGTLHFSGERSACFSRSRRGCFNHLSWSVTLRCR